MGTYSKICIYYFTGTGNSEKVADWITEVASEMEVNTQDINIGKTDRLHIEKPDPEALIIFISPIHGFNYPPAMMHFILRFPRGKNHVALMNTRAGMLIGKFVTPGLTGIAFYFAAFFLKLKGYSIRAMYPVDLPSNWISIHPGLNQNTIKTLHVTNKKRVAAMATKLLSGRRQYKALYEIVQDLLIAPISILYYFIGRFFFAKSFYASSACDNCGLCIKQCPVKAIKWVRKRPFWTFDCESCMHCMSLCPRKAIETGHGYIAVFILLFYLVFWAAVIRVLPVPVWLTENTPQRMVVRTALFFALLAPWYRFIHFLLRFKFMGWLIEHSSLTKYQFWGKRYKALKDKDFTPSADENKA